MYPLTLYSILPSRFGLVLHTFCLLTEGEQCVLLTDKPVVNCLKLGWIPVLGHPDNPSSIVVPKYQALILWAGNKDDEAQ